MIMPHQPKHGERSSLAWGRIEGAAINSAPLIHKGPYGWGLANRRNFLFLRTSTEKNDIGGMQGIPHPRRANVFIRPLRLILGEGGKEDGAKPSYLFFGRLGWVLYDRR